MDIKGKKKQFLEELTKSQGIISTATDKTGIHRQTYYIWINKDKKFKEAVQNIQNKLDDFYEAQFIKLTNEKNDKIILHAAKTRLKKRGYGDKLELQHSGEIEFSPVTINIIKPKEDDE